MRRIKALLPSENVTATPKNNMTDDARARQFGDAKYLAAMTLVMLVAFAFGATSLNADIVWLDEMFSLGNLGAFNPPYSPQDVVNSLRTYSPDHVPLYFILGSQWARLVGWTQLPMRALSLLFGALLIASLYRLAVEALGKRTALLAAILLGTNGFVILYFHEVRMYTLLLLLAALHCWVYWRLSSGHRASWRSWLVFVATAIAVIYTHIFSLYFLAGLILQHLIFPRKSRRWLAIAAGWLLALLTFLPYVSVFSRGFFGVTTSVNTLSNALTTPEMALSVAHVLVNDVILLWIPIAILAGLALIANLPLSILGNVNARKQEYRAPAWMRKLAIKLPSPMLRGAAGGGVGKRCIQLKRQREFLRLLAIFVGMMLTLVLLNGVFRVISINRMRYFLLAMPFFVIVVAHLLLSIRCWRLIAVAFLLVWAAGGYRIHLLAERWTYGGHHTLLMEHPPLQQFSDALRGAARPQDYLFGFAPSPMINWGLKHGWTTADYYTQVGLGIDGGFVNARLRGEELAQDIVDRLDNNPFLLFAYDPSDKPIVFNDVLEAIQADYDDCEVMAHHDTVFVQRYVYHSLACDRVYQPIIYDNGMKIVDRFGDYNADSKSIRVVTGWEVVDEAQLDQYNLSIQLLTSEGSNVRQQDRHLYDDILKWHAAEMSAEGLSPGDYRVVVILYDRYSGAKVSGTDLISGESLKIHPVMQFRIEA